MQKIPKGTLVLFSCLHIITCQAFQYVSLVKLSSLLLVKITISANTHKKAVTDSNKGKMSIKILCSKMIQNTGKLFHQKNYYMERITSWSSNHKLFCILLYFSTPLTSNSSSNSTISTSLLTYTQITWNRKGQRTIHRLHHYNLEQ